VNGDQLVERGATRLLELADRAAARGDGIGEWLSEELRDDAAFLRKLKPSLVKARAKDNGASNQAPTKSESTNPEPEAPRPAAPAAENPVVETPVAESEPTETRAAPPPSPPPKPTSKKKPKSEKKRRGGPPPVVIVGAALVAGIVLAKVIDWRGHAHPRD
jgi:outer membrane biosynthesis protein TonB